MITLTVPRARRRAHQVPARQRNGYRQEHHLGAGRRFGGEVAGQGQAAVPGDDRKIRVALAPLLGAFFMVLAAGNLLLPAFLFGLFSAAALIRRTWVSP